MEFIDKIMDSFSSSVSNAMIDRAAKQFDYQLCSSLQSHLRIHGIKSVILMPGTPGHVHANFWIAENYQQVMASLKVAERSYDYIEITMREFKGRGGAALIYFWYRYVVSDLVGTNSRRLYSELMINDGDVKWTSSAGKWWHNVFLSNLWPTTWTPREGKVEKGERTIADRMNEDISLRESLKEVCAEKQRLDVWPSAKEPFITYSQAVVSCTKFPSKLELEIAEKISRHIRDSIPMTY